MNHNVVVLMPGIVAADDDTFTDVVERAELPVLVDLWAPDCGPCHMLGPVLESLVGELGGRLKVVKVDVTSSPELVERFGVLGVPTLLVVTHGAIVARRTGVVPLPQLRKWLEKALPDAFPDHSTG